VDGGAAVFSESAYGPRRRSPERGQAPALSRGLA
jgi:hypothetical protein